MAATASDPEAIYRTVLEEYLISMARTVVASMNRALEGLLRREQELASQVFLTEPRINEMEIIIDEHAVRLLRGGKLAEQDVRQIVATLKINNDLERIGDLAVNIAERVIALTEMPAAAAPQELEPMTVAVRAMVGKSLGALIYRNAELASEVLASDDLVDQYRDQAFERLLSGMKSDPLQITPSVHFLLATRYLERIADHATNIAEDIVFWVQGMDVRHGRGRQISADKPEEAKTR